jgi:hypothetical protein
MSASVRFLPWVRQGMASRFTNPDGLQSRLAGQTRLPVALDVNGQAGAVSLDLHLYGPGDVTGIDRRAFTRLEPAPGTTDFEPNYLVCMEFGGADFPWLFTPASAGERGRLRPWLCLVVVRVQEGVSLAGAHPAGTAILHLRPPADPRVELPDLAETWAWAHAQVTGGQAGEIDAALGERARSLSRLICPRRLQPNQRYLACLVPVFEVGRLSGLGLPVEAAQLENLDPAWRSGSQALTSLDLPVYLHWSFSTGAGGDFESLAARLRPRQAPDSAGSRTLRVAGLPFSLPDLAGVLFEGALRLPRPGDQAPSEPQDLAGFQQALHDLLDLRSAARRGELSDDAPVLTPPVYGSWAAAEQDLPETCLPEAWFCQANLDPRYRAAAGLGTQLVQTEQEALMASAWEQLGQAQQAAALLKRHAFETLIQVRLVQKRVAPLSTAQMLQFFSPAQSRLLLDRDTPAVSTTLLQKMRISDLPVAFTSPVMRRTTHPGSRVARRQGSVFLGADVLADQMTAEPRASEPPPSLATPQLTQARINQVTQFSDLPFFPNKAQARRFVQAANPVQTYFEQAVAPQPALRKPKLLEGLKQADLLAALDPVRTARSRLASRLPLNGTGAQEPNQEILFDGLPSFPQPMSVSLAELSQDFLLPGAGDIPPDSAILLETNTPFVEAFMLGLNHEMSRELLWREFPSDQRGTFFRRFWDTRGSGLSEAQIPPLDAWQQNQALGEHFDPVFREGQLVLLLRGELLLRYPDAIIYAVRAASKTKLGEEEEYPIFRGRLKPDMTFLGFDLRADQARGNAGDPGWFFVIQEQPAALRFGLDEPPAGAGSANLPPGWDNLTWADVELDGEHLSLAKEVQVGDPAGLSWAFNSAHMAGILRQKPARVAIHASLLLPEEAA